MSEDCGCDYSYICQRHQKEIDDELKIQAAEERLLNLEARLHKVETLLGLNK